MGPERYPDLQPAIPSNRVNASITVRILKPGIVLATVALLAVCSVTGTAIAGTVFTREGHCMSVMAAQGIMLTASAFSISYVLLHGAAAFNNEPVGITRPPELRLHASCFIVARLALLMWIVALIASGVAASRPEVCKVGGRDCKAQITDVVMSSLAFLATGTVLTALEACQYPFQSPDAFHIARKISCRVSSFGEDFIERSVSRGSSFDHGNRYEPEQPKPIAHKESITRKPLPKTPPMSEISSPQRPITPLLPMAQKPKVRGWGEEWTHLVQDTGSKGLTKSDSAVSGLSRSSSGYISSDSSELSVSKRGQRTRPRVVTPSSSISNLTKRSPLSSVRSVEYPDILVRPELRYCPPNIPAPHEWNPARTASLNQLLPVADVYGLQRRSSVGTPPPLMIRRPSRTLPPLAHQRRRPVPARRRRSIDIRIPGAFIDYRLSFDLEQNLEEHAKKIEVMSVEKSGSDRELRPQPPPKDPVSLPEKALAPQRVDSKSRYRENRPTIPFMQTRLGKDSRPHTAKLPDTGKENIPTINLRRLSLGDMTAEFAKLFDV